MIRLKATITTVSSKDIVKIYSDKIWKIYRVPKRILNDKKPQFASQFTKGLNKTLRTKKTLSTVYHSQTDDQMERIN